MDAIKNTIGKAAYDAYCTTRKWKSYNGDLLPKWSDVKPEIQAGWVTAGMAAVLHARAYIEDSIIIDLIDGEFGAKPHNHECNCGTATHTPHETGTCGCVRAMTEAPIPSGTHETLGCPMWEVAGHRITDFSLRQQRGYHRHPCGCWSWSQESTNSIEA